MYESRIHTPKPSNQNNLYNCSNFLYCFSNIQLESYFEKLEISTGRILRKEFKTGYKKISSRPILTYLDSTVAVIHYIFFMYESRIHTPKPSNQNNLYIRYKELRIRVQKKMYPNVLWLHMAWCSKSKLLLFYNYIFSSSTSK
jgi:hypothetical protein